MQESESDIPLAYFDSSTSAWIPLVRFIAIIDILLCSYGIASGIWSAFVYGGMGGTSLRTSFGSSGYYFLWISFTVVFDSLSIVGAALTLKLRPVGRKMLLAMGWISLAFTVLFGLGQMGYALAYSFPASYPSNYKMLWAMTSLSQVIHSIVLPIVVIYVMRLPGVRDLFQTEAVMR